MQGVIEERCERGGRPHRDKLRTKQLGSSGQLSNPIREALILPQKTISFYQIIHPVGIIFHLRPFIEPVVTPRGNFA